MWKTVIKIVCTILFLTALAKYRFLYILSRTWKRDFRTYFRICKALPIFIKIKLSQKPVYYYLDELARKHPQKTAYIFEDEAWTFSAVKEFSDKIAIYFEREGYCKGDSVALLLNNCPEYVCIWLGLSRIGVVAALINTNLANDPLIHSLNVAKCKAVIFGENFCESVSSCVERRLNIKCYQYNRKSQTTQITENCTDLAKSLDSVSPDERLSNYNITSTDPLLYLYTSGTTGLPKAAVINHNRMILVKSFIALLISNPENVILYCPLPLHHGGGGLMGCGHALLWGATVVNKTKFSASNYWKDCAKYKCNVAQYIGEMCRYILSSCPEDNIKHPVKVMFGNGLKPNIWKVFQQKYKISQVFEWYACSEGNLCLLNLDNKVGSVGHIPPYLQKYSSLQLVRYSEESSEPIRNVDGFCMKVGENEPGLAIGAIAVNKRFEPLEYTGYVDAHETKKKILHDVFVKGDEYFNSGDVMSRDEIGYYYFVDRLGDTFRLVS
uniref:Long-chain-fatty-acid--CoA ligase n=1 Tax=Photinus pyralis TaxID=7054 RepID=A0A1Y1L578_PHOPY